MWMNNETKKFLSECFLLHIRPPIISGNNFLIVEVITKK